MIEVGLQEVIATGSRDGSGDGRDRGQWKPEMKSDAEWVDT
jgi:hypothetical protein